MVRSKNWILRTFLALGCTSPQECVRELITWVMFVFFFPLSTVCFVNDYFSSLHAFSTRSALVLVEHALTIGAFGVCCCQDIILKYTIQRKLHAEF